MQWHHLWQQLCGAWQCLVEARYHQFLPSPWRCIFLFLFFRVSIQCSESTVVPFYKKAVITTHSESTVAPFYKNSVITTHSESTVAPFYKKAVITHSESTVAPFYKKSVITTHSELKNTANITFLGTGDPLWWYSTNCLSFWGSQWWTQVSSSVTIRCRSPSLSASKLARSSVDTLTLSAFISSVNFCGTRLAQNFGIQEGWQCGPLLLQKSPV